MAKSLSSNGFQRVVRLGRVVFEESSKKRLVWVWVFSFLGFLGFCFFWGLGWFGVFGVWLFGGLCFWLGFWVLGFG